MTCSHYLHLYFTLMCNIFYVQKDRNYMYSVAVFDRICFMSQKLNDRIVGITLLFYKILSYYIFCV